MLRIVGVQILPLLWTFNWRCASLSASAGSILVGMRVLGGTTLRRSTHIRISLTVILIAGLEGKSYRGIKSAWTAHLVLSCFPICTVAQNAGSCSYGPCLLSSGMSVHLP